jgi:glycosyltransferase involved in cell wall biosynthesis
VSIKVAFSATILARGLSGGGVDGIGTYTRDLGAVLAQDPQVSLIPVGFGIDVPGQALPGAARPGRLRAYVPQAVRCALTTGAFDASVLRSRDVRLFHATDHLVPRLRDIPVVATLMDAIPLSHPAWVRTRLAPMKRWMWRRAAQWADRVLTISEYSKGQLVEHFGLPADRIAVTPLGVSPERFTRVTPRERAQVRQRHGVPEGFFLFVGTLQPRKNLERALDAHARLPDRLREALPFVVVGRAGWGCEDLVRRLTSPDARRTVIWLRYLPEGEVQALMQSATALVFPSLCEGFGLPVLEAFAAGLPVVTSNTTSLPEVAGDAALLVDPVDVDAIAEAMRAIAESPGLAGRLAEAGLRRARAFTWEACAQATLRGYRALL